MEKVSVIIPTYNRLSVLPRAIDSVMGQSYSHWDLWIVDDGSTDNTEEWVNDRFLDYKNIHYLKQENQGVSAARNLAIHRSSGDWIALLDSDDEWLPEKLERQLELAKKQSQLELIHGEEIWIRNGVRVNPKVKHAKSGGRVFSQSIALCCISPSATLMKRDLVNRLGLFDENYPVCEDFEYWLRVTSQHEVGFVSDPVLVKYGGHADQLSRKFKAMDYWRVKALSEYIDCETISNTEREQLLRSMEKRCKILLNGYKKHDNLNNFDEIESYLNSAREAKLKYGLTI